MLQQYDDQNEENMIKGLDDDEIEFLDLVDRTKLAADRRKELEEEQELNDYRNRVATLQEKALEERLQAEIVVNKPKTAFNKSSQQKLLKGVVLKKKESNKRKLSNEDEPNKQVKIDEEVNKKEQEESSEEKTGLKCVAILPGLGCYNETTSDENSSDSEIEESSRKMDILGRKIIHKSKQS